ncbi:hypothetical protein, partial [Sphingomonas echinoides]|uniref:hypothetical protein n=1 Tax=Sphingomonas echinoides TaxID=59803 RepID=UPI002412EBE8
MNRFALFVSAAPFALIAGSAWGQAATVAPQLQAPAPETQPADPVAAAQDRATQAAEGKSPGTEAT